MVTRVEQGEPDEPLVACSVDGFEKYILGPVEVEGERIEDATFGFGTGQTGVSTGQVVGQAPVRRRGRQASSPTSAAGCSASAGDQNRFAIVLDGLVISAPDHEQVIPNGRAADLRQLHAGVAETLANQLKFGALPLSFTEESIDSVSATLGTEQLRIGLVAGLIGLLLVVVLLVAAVPRAGPGHGGLAAGRRRHHLRDAPAAQLAQGYRLSLPGVAGLIVAIGITADSFIVYFERVRDEIRDGPQPRRRPSSGAGSGPGGRSSPPTRSSFLAAVVLYLLAVGGVRGFAFTLGLTTVIDLLVVFLFTKPLVTLLARTRFFADGHRLSGFDPEHLGSVVARRAVRSGPRPGQPAGPGPGTTLAERKRAADRRRRRGSAVKIDQWGNRLYTGETSYDFVGRRRTWYAIAGAVVLVSLLALLLRGFNLGIDFTGGRGVPRRGAAAATSARSRPPRSSRTSSARTRSRPPSSAATRCGSAPAS